MNRTGDAVVVGGGVLGASLAYHLAQRGMRRVILCEQGRPPGQGATTRSGGLLRQHHTARCDVRLAVRGLAAFRTWADTVGGDCGYRRTRFAMLVAPEHADHLAKNVAAVNEAGGASQLIDPAELAELHPALRAGDVVAAYEPDGGYADPLATTHAFLDRAGSLGVRCGEGVVVTGLLTTGDRVVGVRTNTGPISAPIVVLAAGAWSAPLAAGIGVRVPVTARRIGIARVDTGLAGGDLPVCIDDTTGCYFRPDDAGRLFFGVPADPDVDLAGHPAPLAEAEIGAARAALACRVPAASAAAVDGSRAGFDGYTPDRRPMIGRAGPDGCYVCTGFSGGGFKLAPAVGDLAAAEIVTGGTAELLEPYRPQRFGTGDLITSDYPYVHS